MRLQDIAKAGGDAGLTVLSEEELKGLHGVLLEILDDLHSICAENGLRYVLIGGSAIGALHSGGIIPWDDDIDIAVPREDYERLYEILSRQESDTYCVETYQNGNKDFIYPYMKIYDKIEQLIGKTPLFEVKNIEKELGLKSQILLKLEKFN